MGDSPAMVSIPSPTPRMRRAYDHRLREHVVRSGARSLARHVPIPRSTIQPAVIDNFSWKILAWTVAARLEPTTTCQVLIAAGKHLVSAGRPLLYADSGVENVRLSPARPLP
jgi:hypothetical protein